MGKNAVHHVIIHAEKADLNLIADQVSKFHVEVIERRLNQSDLTAFQKMKVIEEIIKALEKGEPNKFVL